MRNTIWGLGIRARNLLKRAGLLGPLERVLSKLAPLLIRPPSKEIEITLPSGMRMVMPPDCPASRSFATGLYEVEITRLFNSIVKEGMTVVDLGANIGYYSLHASRLVGTPGHVYSFEPDPTAYAYLLRNIEANRCLNVVAVDKAVSGTTGTMTFIRDPHTAEGFLTKEMRSGDSIAVQTVTLDDFFKQEGWPHVELIKMDIEGSEKAAVEGMRELSRRNPNVQLIMEFDLANLRRCGTTGEALASVLQEVGFHKGYVIEQGMKPFSIAQGLPKSHAIYNLILTKEQRN